MQSGPGRSSGTPRLTASCSPSRLPCCWGWLGRSASSARHASAGGAWRSSALNSAGPACAPRLFGALTQAGVAALLLAAEGAAIDPSRLAVAVLCGLAALLCSAFVFRATRDRVFALLAAFAAVLDHATAPPPLRRLALRPARATVPYRLFVPNRPPPLAA